MVTDIWIIGLFWGIIVTSDLSTVLTILAIIDYEYEYEYDLTRLDRINVLGTTPYDLTYVVYSVDIDIHDVIGLTTISNPYQS